MTDEQKKKRDFRATAKWKKFRAFMKKENKVDYITGKPLYKGFNLHHCDLNPKHYEHLEPENFTCLNKQTHEMIHWFARYKNWRELLQKTSEVLEKMEKLND